MEELEAQATPSISEKIEELKRTHDKRKKAREQAIDELLGDAIDSLRTSIERFNQQVEVDDQNEVSFILKIV